MSGQVVKLDGWKHPQNPLGEDEARAYRDIIVEAVRMLYSLNKQRSPPPFLPSPVSLMMIHTYVHNKVEALMLKGSWRYFGHIDECSGMAVMRMKRTVDRQVNFAASPECGARIVSVDSGYYIPAEEIGAWAGKRERRE